MKIKQFNYRDYTDFIKDESFVKWHFTKDSELNKFWEEFIKENPHLQVHFDEACSFLSKITIKKYSLDIDDKKHILSSIKNSLAVEQNRRKRKKRLYILSSLAAACVIFICILTHTVYHTDQESSLDHTFDIETVALSAKDIQIITPSGTTTLKNNANIHLQSNNTALIQEEGIEEKNLSLNDTDKLNKIIVPFGKRSQLTLSDGTKIWLNSGSTLEFPTIFKGNTREIYLTGGEAFAEVAKSEIPFIVHSRGFDVKVYGTKFNVAAYDNAKPFVLLESGSVGIKTDTDEIIMKPREMITLSDTGIETQKNIDIEEFTSWKDGYLILKGTSMDEILKRLERYYNLSFQYDSENYGTLRNRACSGKLILSENIDNVLTAFALLAIADYRKEDQKIFINVKP